MSIILEGDDRPVVPKNETPMQSLLKLASVTIYLRYENNKFTHIILFTTATSKYYCLTKRQVEKY